MKLPRNYFLSIPTRRFQFHIETEERRFSQDGLRLESIFFYKKVLLGLTFYNNYGKVLVLRVGEYPL